MTLSELSLHEAAYVDLIREGAHGPGLVSRLEAMGFLPNKSIRVVRRAAMNGPLEVRVGSTTNVAIRRVEADLVMVHKAAAPVELP
ncbi:MAG: ferrous iron transport protein A [Burkholderiaceae bacterium]|nr:ferrous iron transport protein A [Burkholderiaceae bacterium]